MKKNKNYNINFDSEEAAWEALKFVAKNKVMYSAFTTKINVCKHRHASIGSKECPICGEPIIDQYARVVGFYTPVSNYQKIRKREFDHRSDVQTIYAPMPSKSGIGLAVYNRLAKAAGFSVINVKGEENG